MRLAQVITRSDSVGGASLHVIDVSLGMLRRGHDVHVLVGGSGPYLAMLHDARLDYEVVPGFERPLRPVADMRALVELRHAFRRIRPDVVATHTNKAGALGRLAARSLGIPCTYTPHGWAFGPPFGAREAALYTAAERRLARVGDRIITVSDAERRAGLQRGVGRASRYVVVPLGLADVDSRADPAVQPVHLIVTARLEPPKDHASLVAALAELKNLAWTCDFVGDGPARADVEAAIALHGLTSRVRMLGYRDDVPQLLARSSVFVLTSRSESLPASVLEAMRAGLPVVASDVGGIGEAVRDGVDGLLVPVGQVHALARALRRVIVDANLRCAMGRSARARFEVRFSLERMLDELESLYRSVNSRDTRLASSGRS